MTEPAKPEKTPKKAKLSRRFKLVAGGTVAGVAATGAAIIALFGAASGNVPLTKEEAAVAQSLFGPEFRTDDVRKQYVRSWAGGAIQYPAAMVPLSRRHIYFFQPELRVDDLTMTSDYDFNLYMHEMTHIWQHRGNWAPICRTYDYTLTANARFSQFCNEQQASIIGDYAENFLNPRNVRAIELLSQNTSTREGNEYLMRVVEARFAAARPSRLRIEENNRAVYRCSLRFNTVVQAAAKPEDENRRVIRQCFENPAAEPPPVETVDAESTTEKGVVVTLIEATQRLLPRPPQA